MNIQNVKKLTEKIDIIASSIEKKRPDLALALDLISDRLERLASVPKSIVDIHKQYLRAGGESTLEHFLKEDIPGFLKYLKKDGADIWHWDKTEGPAAK